MPLKPGRKMTLPAPSRFGFCCPLPPRPVLSVLRPPLFCAAASFVFNPEMSFSFCTKVLLNDATFSVKSAIKVVWLLSRSRSEAVAVARFANASTAAAVVSSAMSLRRSCVAAFAYPRWREVRLSKRLRAFVKCHLNSTQVWAATAMSSQSSQ